MHAHTRAIAFYLPQFHPIPENDAWWEPGFTEWTHVRRAQPLFPGHRQPRVPHPDIGYYNLTDPLTRKKQAEIAARYGVEGFCYWHYWLAGRRLLERPFQDILAGGQPDFPFCLAWANHSWSGIWTGSPDRMLAEQTYPGIEDYARHFEAVLPAFRDPRYLKIDGRPIFVVYNPMELPDAWGLVDTWNQRARAAGLPDIYFIAIAPTGWPADMHGFAGYTQPLPNVGAGDFQKQNLQEMPRTRRYSYGEAVQRMIPEENSPTFYPSILPGWDNTPRCGARGFVLEGGSPQLFEGVVAKTRRLVADRSPDHRLIFLKSWNEWAEGNFLEPDAADGYAYLEALQRGLNP